MSLAEQLLDVPVVVQRTGLVSATQEVVQRPRHLMFDLVTEANEEPEVVCGIAINRRRLLVEASLKLPGYLLRS